MPAQAGRKKIRCPKCTALFSEPSKTVFECPICSCHLSANGAVVSTDSLSNEARERDLGLTETPSKSEEAIRVQSQEQSSKDGSESQQDTGSELGEVSRRASSTQIYKEEKQPSAQIKTLPLISDADGTEGKPSSDSFLDNHYNCKDVAAKENTSKENDIAVVKVGEIEGEGPLEKNVASNKWLQLQAFQTSRCEFSFKYSLEGAVRSESDSYKRRLPSSKFSELEKVVPNNDTSDVSFHTPLKVRIVNSESSDQSEHGRYSFSSDTDSQDGSESEFDFPAPWAEGLQVSTALDSSHPNELSQHQLSEAISATPHLLELLDEHDVTANEDYDVQESSNHFKGSEIINLVGDTAKAMLCIEAENELRDGMETASLEYSSQVIDLANSIKSVALDDNENSVENGSTQGFHSGGGREAVSICNHDKHESLDSSSNVDREASDTVSEAIQALQLIAQRNETDECMNVGVAKVSEVSETLHSSSNYKLSASSALANSSSQQDPLSASCLYGSSHMMLSEISNGNRSPVLEGELDDDLVPDSGKVPHAYIERDKNLSDHHLLQDIEMELDLYSHQEVDEWQHPKEEPTPSVANYDASLLQNGVHHSDLQQMEEHSSVFSEYAVKSAPLANSQPYGCGSHHVSDHFSYGASSSSHMYTYQVPSQAMILPAAFPNQAMAPFGYHTVSNACTICSHHHYSFMQPHLPPHCTICLNHSGSVACNSAHSDHWSCHQAHHHIAPFPSSLVAYTPEPSNLGERYGFPSANLRVQGSSSSKVSRYPPLPKDGASPYFACKGCTKVLRVPLDLPLSKGFIQKLRCSACGRVTKFSVKQTSKQRQVSSGSPSEQLDSRGGAAYALPLAQHNAHRMASSQGHNVLGPMLPWTYTENSGQVLSQVNTDLYTSRVSDLGWQGGDNLRGRPRGDAFDSSTSTDPRYLENIAGVNGVTSLREKVLESTNGVSFERTGQHAVASFHVAVDEKDEGLDFGAPRISDGDSFDQSDSRMRSPEDIQAQRTCAEIPEGAPLGDCEPPQGQFPDWNEEHVSSVQGKKPGSPLLVLLNQESTRFMISLDPRAPYDYSVSASQSPVSDSPLADNTTRSQRKKQNASRSHASAVSRGPKYIAGLLRRSLRDISKGGQ